MFLFFPVAVNVFVCSCAAMWYDMYCYPLLRKLLGTVMRGEYSHCAPLCVSP